MSAVNFISASTQSSKVSHARLNWATASAGASFSMTQGGRVMVGRARMRAGVLVLAGVAGIVLAGGYPIREVGRPSI